GEVAPAQQGGTVDLNLNVQSASWFGVDRIEVYVDGQLAYLNFRDAQPKNIVDFDTGRDGKITLNVPTRQGDSWIVVIAMGLQPPDLMSPVSLDIPYGEIQLSKVASDAFSRIPVVNGVIGALPPLPDWHPIPAYAVSNPIYLDTDGNGKYDPPLPP